MSKDMSTKFSDRDLARACILLATAVCKAGVAERVRAFVPVVRDEVKSLAAETGGKISKMDEAFSAVYTLLAAMPPSVG